VVSSSREMKFSHKRVMKDSHSSNRASGSPIEITCPSSPVDLSAGGILCLDHIKKKCFYPLRTEGGEGIA
jgi:hypothetical protein